MFKKILIAIDGSQPAVAAIEAGVELAGQLDAKVVLLHVVDVSAAFLPEVGITDRERLADLHRVGEGVLTHAIARVPASVKAERLLVEGEPADAIITAAREWSADAIVLGSDSRGRLAHFLLGSTADSVIRRAPCPVLTVRPQPATLPRI